MIRYLVVQRVAVVEATSADQSLERAAAESGIPIEKLAATELNKIQVVYRDQNGEQVSVADLFMASPDHFLATPG